MNMFSINKKLAIGVFCLALAFILPGPSYAQTAADDDLSDLDQDSIVTAQSTAQSATDLQAQIAALQQQLNALLAQIGTTTTTTTTALPSACAGITFSRNLTISSTGTDVRCLQALLNQSADTQVASSGAGSPGNETSYFGTLTRAAVVKYQNKYASAILTPLGLSSGTGFVGSSTRTQLNSLIASLTAGTGTGTGTGTGNLPAGCTSTSGFSPLTGLPCSGTGTGTGSTGGPTTGTEGILTITLNPTPANNVSVYEGDTNVGVFGLKVQAVNSNITLQRFQINFGATNPTNFLSNISVYDGSTQIVSSALNSSTVIKESSSNYYIILTGFNYVIPQGNTKTLTVQATAQSSISREFTLPQSITLSIPGNGIRGVDTRGISQYAPTTTLSRTINLRASQATQATLTLSRNANSPLSRNIGSGTDGEVDAVTLMTFDLRSTRDALTLTDINNVRFSAATSTSSTNTGTTELDPQTIYLIDGTGNTLAAASVSGGTASFNDMNFAIPANSTQTLTIQADYTGITQDNQGSMVVVSGGSNIIAQTSIGANLASGSITGSADSYPVFFYQVSPTFTVTNISTTSNASTQTAAATISATFSIQATAQGGDIYLPKTGAFTVNAVANNTGIGTPVSAVYNLPSGAIDTGTSIRIPQDTTVTFSITATYVLATTPGNFDLRIAEIDWGTSDTGSSANTSTYMNGLSQFISAIRFLQ